MLNQPKPLTVRWASTARAVSACAEVVLGDDLIAGRPLRLRLRGDNSDIGSAFRRLPGAQLVIVGAPGSGKSVMAMLLVLDLLATAQPDDPVPVLLPATTWRVGETAERWFARRLAEEHPAIENKASTAPVRRCSW